MTEQPLIGPQPRYPTPWRAVAIHSGLVLIESASGQEIARTTELAVAELIVDVANRAAEGSTNTFVLEANEALRELEGQLAEARAEIEALRRTTTVCGYQWRSASGQCSNDDSSAGLHSCTTGPHGGGHQCPCGAGTTS